MGNSNDRAPNVSSASYEAGLVRPGRTLLCSSTARWQSLLLQQFEQPGCVDNFETFASPDYLLVFSLKGEYEIESFSGRCWRKAAYRPGIGGLTSPLTQNRLRWHSAMPTTQVLRLYIPEAYFLEVREAYRRPGSKLSLRLPDALQFADPTAFSVAQSLAEQVALGAPNLYAEASARFLAAHLLLSLNRSCDQSENRIAVQTLPDKRFRRVLEYMEHHFAHDISLPTLAREAGVSLFHFMRLFKAKLGATPHQHVVRLRMQHAKFLLRYTDLPIADIALKSGYVHGGHFAGAFKQRTGMLPQAFRQESRR